MSDDISSVLRSWAYEDQEGLQVREIQGDDGRPKLQLRVDLGILQMERLGRPDGTRPYGCESLLEYYRSQAERHRRRQGWYEGYQLEPADCAALRQESLQYYHRRIALMALQEYGRAIADADHNLQILDLLKAFAHNREDWLASEQYRAFILTHRIQCLAMQHLVDEDVNGALVGVDEGARRLKEIFAEEDRLEEWEESAERATLEDLRRKVEARYQISYRQRLHILLDDALRREDPDTAADLRAQLRELEMDE